MSPNHTTRPRGDRDGPTTDGVRGPGRIVSVVGGKGGVGKTNVAVNVAVAACALRARVLLVDGDLGLANVDVLLGLTPRLTAAEIHAGDCDWADAIVPGPAGLHVLPAASARLDLAASRANDLDWLLSPLFEATRTYDLVLVDIGAGIGPAALSLASMSDRALLVTTPEPPSITDAYATLKVLSRVAPELDVELVVNSSRDDTQARDTHSQLELMSKRFLGRDLPLRSALPRDPRLEDAVARQMAVVEAFPLARASRGLVELARNVLRDSSRRDLQDAGGPQDGGQWRRVGS